MTCGPCRSWIWTTVPRWIIAPARLRGLAVRTRNRLLAGSKPEIDTDLRHKLVAIYRDDIVKLQDLLGRDLSAWLEVSR